VPGKLLDLNLGRGVCIFYVDAPEYFERAYQLCACSPDVHVAAIPDHEVDDILPLHPKLC
jgi:hypothetical protein